MAIIYEDSSGPRNGPPPKIMLMDANKIWLDHFSNSLILTAIQQRPKDLSEKIQATKELTICQKKMDFWSKHPRFEMQTTANEAVKLKSLWGK